MGTNKKYCDEALVASLDGFKINMRQLPPEKVRNKEVNEVFSKTN